MKIHFFQLLYEFIIVKHRASYNRDPVKDPTSIATEFSIFVWDNESTKMTYSSMSSNMIRLNMITTVEQWNLHSL